MHQLYITNGYNMTQMTLHVSSIYLNDVFDKYFYNVYFRASQDHVVSQAQWAHQDLMWVSWNTFLFTLIMLWSFDLLARGNI